MFNGEVEYHVRSFWQEDAARKADVIHVTFSVWAKVLAYEQEQDIYRLPKTFRPLIMAQID